MCCPLWTTYERTIKEFIAVSITSLEHVYITLPAMRLTCTYVPQLKVHLQQYNHWRTWPIWEAPCPFKLKHPRRIGACCPLAYVTEILFITWLSLLPSFSGCWGCGWVCLACWQFGWTLAFQRALSANNPASTGAKKLDSPWVEAAYSLPQLPLSPETEKES